MTDTRALKIANCFVAKLVNIPDIHCVSRLALGDFKRTVVRPDLFRGSLTFPTDDGEES